MLKLTGRDEVMAHVGQELGVSDWLSVPQSDIDKFADVTGDHQFIHVDVERARATPFGGTVAHGFYTLSLAPSLLWEFFSLDGFLFLVNYGLTASATPRRYPSAAACACARCSPASRRSPAACNSCSR